VQRLLSLLADGQYRSGSSLVASLGISSPLLRKSLDELRALGVSIESSRGRGYRISGGLDLLNEHLISTELAPLNYDRIDVLKTVDSTNRVAQTHMSDGSRQVLVAAEYQGEGRGRRGRQWVSPYAANLYLSLGYRFKGGAASLQGLSLAVGLAVQQTLASLGVTGVQLKWPNDLLLEKRKLGGVLIELAGDLSGECSVVIGVGLNVKMPGGVKSSIDQEWADLGKHMSGALTRSQLLIEIVRSLTQLLNEFEGKGFSEYAQHWQAVHAFQDHSVRLLMGHAEVEGICRGVDAKGEVLVEVEGKLNSYPAGEISLRGVSSAS
jgi:BirA family transcriptional regulator, biotin operon repressor / biotin---[acetyl-CoA-carboxylase] ligase